MEAVECLGLLIGGFIVMSSLLISAEEFKKDELVHFLTYKYVRKPLKLPLTDDIQLFGFSDKITKSVCAVMEMAALSGWKYQLIGPNMTFSEDLGDVKTNKIIVLASIVDALPNSTVIIFADSFDTVIQGSMDDFRRDFFTTLSISTEKPKWSDVVIYNAERNCWPYRHWNEEQYCEIVQGSAYIKAQSKMIDPEGPQKKWSNPGMEAIEPNEILPLTCTRQESLIPTRYLATTPYKYLNSGLAAGRVSAYKEVVASIWKLLEMKVPKRCFRFFQDDQGMIGYLYSTQAAPITIDHNFTLFGNFNFNSADIDKQAQKWSLSADFDTVDSQGFKTHVRHVSLPFAVHLAGAGEFIQKYKNGLVHAKFAKRKDWERFLSVAFVYVNGEKTPLKSVCGVHHDRTGGGANSRT